MLLWFRQSACIDDLFLYNLLPLWLGFCLRLLLLLLPLRRFRRRYFENTHNVRVFFILILKYFFSTFFIFFIFGRQSKFQLARLEYTITVFNLIIIAVLIVITVIFSTFFMVLHYTPFIYFIFVLVLINIITVSIFLWIIIRNCIIITTVFNVNTLFNRNTIFTSCPFNIFLVPASVVNVIIRCKTRFENIRLATLSIQRVAVKCLEIKILFFAFLLEIAFIHS